MTAGTFSAALSNERSALPHGITAQLDEAVKRTGWTDALRKAAQRIPVLLSQSPADLEKVTAEVYRELV